MNGNRMKYSSTPTYGMQKRSPLGKNPLFQQKSVMGPDFARATQQSTAAPAASLFTMPVQQPDPAVQTANPVQPGVFYGSAPYQQPFAGGYPMGGTVPGAIPAANPWMPVPPAMPQQTSGFQPLGNTVPPLQNSGFGARAQGFVPPQAASAPHVQPASAPGAMGYAPQAPVTPMNPMPNVGYMQAGVPFLNQGTVNYAPLNAAMMPSGAAAQAGSMPGTPQNIPMQGGVPLPGSAQQGGYAPKQRKPLDFNLLFGIFFFGLLPLLFVPCIFVSSGLNFLRYLFIGLSVAGLGVIWYRQMYSSTARVVLSVVYVALSIIALSLSMQGGQDLRTAAGGSAVPASVQSTLSPEQSAVPAAAELTPSPSPEPTPAAKSEVQERLELFMNNWAGNQTEAMASLVQPSWASQQENAAAQLFQTVSLSGTAFGDVQHAVQCPAQVHRCRAGAVEIVRKTAIFAVKAVEIGRVDPGGQHGHGIGRKNADGGRAADAQRVDRLPKLARLGKCEVLRAVRQERLIQNDDRPALAADVDGVGHGLDAHRSSSSL